MASCGFSWVKKRSKISRRSYRALQKCIAKDAWRVPLVIQLSSLPVASIPMCKDVCKMLRQRLRILETKFCGWLCLFCWPEPDHAKDIPRLVLGVMLWCLAIILMCGCSVWPFGAGYGPDCLDNIFALLFTSYPEEHLGWSIHDPPQQLYGLLFPDSAPSF